MQVDEKKLFRALADLAKSGDVRLLSVTPPALAHGESLFRMDLSVHVSVEALEKLRQHFK